MKNMSTGTYEESTQDAKKLYTMLETINTCPIPVIARVNGSAYGGGIGIISACDIAFATSFSTFCFSEVCYYIIC